MAFAQIQPVILSGGAGTRLWPLSRAQQPKQFLPLAGERTMVQQAALRVREPRFAAPLAVCNHDHRFILAEQLREVGCLPRDILLEPMARNTAPAAAVAALWLLREQQDGLLLVMPSDHVIADGEAFRAAIEAAAPAAEQGRLITFGVSADRAETGYGYIQRGELLPGFAGVFSVARFVEKPDAETARGYVAEGCYAWNSGIFLFRASTYLAELERHQPAMVAACRRALDEARRDIAGLRLDAEAFAGCPSLSIDYAVMEHTTAAAVVPIDIGWNDVGGWGALWDIGLKDAAGNVVEGDVVTIDSSGNLVRGDGVLTALVGVSDLVVVAVDDAVLVVARDRAQDVRKVVEALRARGRSQHEARSTVYRPWGSYRGIDLGVRHQVKHIMVKPGMSLSLQMHHHRAEHWVVVAGTARVVCGDNSFLLYEDQSTYIPAGVRHRLENPGKIPVHLIEVQSGSYLGEDDIVRFEDAYGRAAQ